MKKVHVTVVGKAWCSRRTDLEHVAVETMDDWKKVTCNRCRRIAGMPDYKEEP